MSAQPVVYFIDDSATMREVIKIAFRRENIDVVTCHDATSALDLIERGTPDVVISDVIMPGRDGYDVCQYIKQHPRLNGTPVILMSGVVNKAVAEKAFAVRADELIRKPFQPQDLITRVRHLMTPRGQVQQQEPAPQVAAATVAANAPQSPLNPAAALSSIFSGPMPSRPAASAPRTLGPIPVPRSIPPRMAPPAAPPMAQAAVAQQQASQAATTSQPPAAQPAMPPQPMPQGTELAHPATTSKAPAPPSGGHASNELSLKVEIARLISQIKKLEAELNAEREYSRALEEHVKTLQEMD
ncbi:MAG TPA: response regulator [candidate division Zixibacteria bacterium]|nr:response regulator [candidate division Zixibacteria bacterium]